jgi:hypothetical protein
MFEQFLLIPFPAVHPYQGFLDGLIIGKRGLGVNKKMAGCVSKGKASPVTAKLKCPLWKGKRYS